MLPSNLRLNRKLQEVLIVAGLALLIFIPRLTDLGLFVGHDELMRNRQSRDSFVALAEGRWGDVYSSNFGATNLTWAKAAAETVRYVWLRWQGVNLTLAETIHYGPDIDPLPGAVFNGLITLAVYWFAKRLFDRRTAIVVVIILALDPYLLSESRILRTEAAFAIFNLLAVLSVALYVRYRQGSYLVWCGFWTAWAFATKFNGLILLPVIGAVLLVAMWGRRHTETWSGQFRRLLLDGLLWAGSALVVTFIIWPTLWVRPLEILVEHYNFVLNFGFTERDHIVFFFLGKTVAVLPALYYILVVLYKTTPLVWFGLAAFGWLVWHTWRRPQSDPLWAGFSFPVAGGLIIVGFSLFFIVAMAFGSFKTERYMISPVVGLNVAAGLGLVFVGQWLYQKWSRTTGASPLFWGVTLSLILIGHALFTWLSHPYYFSYYNPLLGGGTRAMTVLQLGSGEGVDLALDYLNKKPNSDDLTLVCGTNQPRCDFAAKGPAILNERALNAVHAQWVGADYVVSYIFQQQRGDYPPGVIEYLERHPGPEYTVKLQGIEYSKVYPAPAAQFVAASELTGISTLLGYSLSRQALTAGEDLTLTFYWENDGRVEQDMFVELSSPDGYVWAAEEAALYPEFEAQRETVGAILAGEAILSLPPGIPAGNYALKMGYRRPDGTLIGLFSLPAEGDTIRVDWPEKFEGVTASGPATRLNLKLGNALTVTGFEIDQTEATPGESLWLTLFWQATQDVTHDYVVNLRLLGPTGEEVTYRLGRPIQSGRPTNQWQQGQVVQDPWALDIPEDAAPGTYQLKLVVFDAKAETVAGQAALGQIVVLPREPISSPAQSAEAVARFGQKMALLDYDLYFDIATPTGITFSPAFFWQSLADFDDALDLSLTLREAGTGQVINTWQAPLAGSTEKAAWAAGETIEATYQFEVETPLQGNYHLDITVFTGTNGAQAEPLPLDNGPDQDYFRIENVQDKIIVRTLAN